eukprot:scaffold3528_cov61-Cylindrotheca_fusiformis.AAC.1
MDRIQTQKRGDDELVHCNAREVERHRRNSDPYSPANRPLVQFIASLPPHPVGAKVVDPSISHHIDYKNHPPLRQDRLIDGEIKSNAATIVLEGETDVKENKETTSQSNGTLPKSDKDHRSIVMTLMVF